MTDLEKPAQTPPREKRGRTLPDYVKINDNGTLTVTNVLQMIKDPEVRARIERMRALTREGKL
jgi:hypothetical protein